MGCLGSVVLWVFLREDLQTVSKQKSSEAEPRTGLMGGPSLPQKHVFSGLWCSCLLPCWWLFAWAGSGQERSLGRALSRPRPSRGSAAVQEGHGSLQCRNCHYLGLFLGFQCLVLAGDSLNSLSLLCRLKQAFPHVSAARPSLLPKQHTWDKWAQKPICVETNWQKVERSIFFFNFDHFLVSFWCTWALKGRAKHGRAHYTGLAFCGFRVQIDEFSHPWNLHVLSLLVKCPPSHQFQRLSCVGLSTCCVFTCELIEITELSENCVGDCPFFSWRVLW